MAKKSRPQKGTLPAGAGSPPRRSARAAVASAAASPPVAAPAASALTIGHASAAPPPSSDPDEAAEPEEAPDEATAPDGSAAHDEADAPLALIRLSNKADCAENTGPTVKEGGKKNPAKGSSAALFAADSDPDSDYTAANDVAAAAEPLEKIAGGGKLPAKRGKAGALTKKRPAKKSKTTVDKVWLW
jgi:hypothetical protein